MRFGSAYNTLLYITLLYFTLHYNTVYEFVSFSGAQNTFSFCLSLPVVVFLGLLIFQANKSEKEKTFARDRLGRLLEYFLLQYNEVGCSTRLSS